MCTMCNKNTVNTVKAIPLYSTGKREKMSLHVNFLVLMLLNYVYISFSEVDYYTLIFEYTCAKFEKM